MGYGIRPMRKEDIPQVNDIDREAFPGWWPSTNYEHELGNRLAYFIVACETDPGNAPPSGMPQNSAPEENGFSRLVSRLKGFLNHGEEAGPADKIVGFAGFWVMAGEAHVMTIAVREARRRQGIGELLMLSLINLATSLRADAVTLEVRVTNYGAQNLYNKLGFSQAGIRHGYYTDNREDACVMSTDNIQSVPFQSHLKKLEKLHARRWNNRLLKALQP